MRGQQVVGRKYVRLYAPEPAAAMYPHASGLHTNTSRADLERSDLAAAFPLLAAAPFFEAVLEPGDLLYIPPKWWHFVKALTTSFSCSFWWT